MKSFIIINENKYEIIGEIKCIFPKPNTWASFSEHNLKIKCPRDFKLDVGDYELIIKNSIDLSMCMNNPFISLSAAVGESGAYNPFLKANFHLKGVRELSKISDDMKIIQLSIGNIKLTELSKSENRGLTISELFG